MLSQFPLPKTARFASLEHAGIQAWLPAEAGNISALESTWNCHREGLWGALVHPNILPTADAL